MKRTLLRRVVPSFGAAFALLAVMIFPVFAQESQQTANGFRISPVKAEYTIDKGKSEVVNLTLENPANVATTARAVYNDFVASDKEDGEPRLILDDKAEAPKNSFKSLAQPIADVPLGPKEKKDVSVTLKVPSDANSGGYYGAIRFVPVSGASDSGNVGLTASVGTIVLVTVPGDLNEQLNLVQLSAATTPTKEDEKAKAKSFFMNGQVTVLTRLENTGDIHVKPIGKILVKNMLGKTVQEIEFNLAGQGADNRANILPGSTRAFENKIDKTNLVGRYTIEANLGYSSGSSELISANSSFWYMPIWAILVVVAIVVLLVAGVYFLVRKFKKSPKRSKK